MSNALQTPVSKARAVLGAAVVGVTLLAAPAHAQFSGQSNAKAVPVKAPDLGTADSPPLFLTYALLLVLAAGIIGANLMPSKRGHQD